MTKTMSTIRGPYEIAGLTALSVQKMLVSQLWDYVDQVLGYWKAVGRIKGFSFVAAKRNSSPAFKSTFRFIYLPSGPFYL